MSLEKINLSFLAPSTTFNSFVPVDVSIARRVLGHELFVFGHAVFAFVGWPYENTDPRGGLTCALRTRKSGIITLDVDSLTVDVLSTRQARDVPRIRCSIHSANAVGTSALSQQHEMRTGLSRRGRDSR